MLCPDAETLNDVLEERRSPEEARAVREHVFACAGCHERWTALERGRAAMQELRWQDPPAALRSRALHGGRSTSRLPLRWAAAAVAIALLALMWVFSPWNHPTPSPTVTPPGPDAALARVSAAERAYHDAIADLEKQVQSQRKTWPPELQVTFNENMALIDAAIEETRAAAEQHADHPEAQRFLLAAYQEKVDLLTSASAWQF